MAEIVYTLCALTSLACAILLWRGYARTGTRLLLWSSLCFAGLTINNVMLVLDRVVLPAPAFATWRLLAALVGISLLLYGLIHDE